MHPIGLLRIVKKKAETQIWWAQNLTWSLWWTGCERALHLKPPAPSVLCGATRHARHNLPPSFRALSSGDCAFDRLTIDTDFRTTIKEGLRDCYVTHWPFFPRGGRLCSEARSLYKKWKCDQCRNIPRIGEHIWLGHDLHIKRSYHSAKETFINLPPGSQKRAMTGITSYKKHQTSESTTHSPPSQNNGSSSTNHQKTQKKHSHTGRSQPTTPTPLTKGLSYLSNLRATRVPTWCAGGRHCFFQRNIRQTWKIQFNNYS